MQSELERISDLAKKAAVLDGCMYVVYQKEDGTYARSEEHTSELQSH